ncbi:MAG: hypothetical protein GOVbin3264_23 [Prokaryotic dsDNA virus sp.]|nr:MAG: hypothetical protein GOVbin3264_23 [Prokaryotic dsDNA virus sp.]|tara:strand:- start:65 stop:289 length:225 start_codon:yes stop_codon:yes gene_type:complete
MSKIIKGKKIGRLKESCYKSIYPNYKDDDLRNKKMIIPEIIKHDISWELITGMKYKTDVQELQYLRTKHTPENQ